MGQPGDGRRHQESHLRPRADVVIECAGSATVFRQSVEAVRPGGQVVWLGKVDVEEEVAFRWEP